MTPIIDYDVIAAGDLASLVMQTREFIKKGWKPLGGIAYDSGSQVRPYLYLQAIVKREERLWNGRYSTADATTTPKETENTLFVPVKDYYPDYEETNEP